MTFDDLMNGLALAVTRCVSAPEVKAVRFAQEWLQSNEDDVREFLEEQDRNS